MSSLVLALLLITSSLAFSEGFKGDITFTRSERKSHQKHLEELITVSRDHLNKTWSEHKTFHQKYGFSKYYGDRNKTLNTKAKRKAQLTSLGASSKLESKLVPTSCIGLTLEALKVGFHAPQDPSLIQTWEKINKFTVENGVEGTALIHALQKLNWKVYYWNPSLSEMQDWDLEEQNWKSKGWHAYRYQNVTKHNQYYFNHVDNKTLLVDFKDSPPKEFLNFPFFVGVAHTGYHVFSGFYGEVIEAHSTRSLSSVDNLERSKFNPYTGGGPLWRVSKKEKYRSGLIAVPPKH